MIVTVRLVDHSLTCKIFWGITNIDNYSGFSGGEFTVKLGKENETKTKYGERMIIRTQIAQREKHTWRLQYMFHFIARKDDTRT